MASANGTVQTHPVFTCQCGRTFVKKAHYSRHWQTKHDPDRQPLVCQFCHKDSFQGRTDVLREHYKKCPGRGSAPIPPSLERGRKRHACDECSRLKVKCDNETPCGKCKDFGRNCVKKIRGGTESPMHGSPRASTPADAGRSSINFLLNSPGERDFMREFPGSATLSPSNPPAQIANSMGDGYPFVTGDVPAAVPAYHNYRYQIPSNNLDAFLSHLEFQTTFERQTNSWMAGDNVIPWAGAGNGLSDRGELEQIAEFIREKLKHTAALQSAPQLPPGDVIEAIDSITADSIAANIRLYFRHWHKHAPMIHEATFNPCTAALPLVLALMGLGGMYSKDSEAVIKLKLSLDTIETYIFSIPGLNVEYDSPGRAYVRYGPEASEKLQQYQLEELQGAYLSVVLQYWTGNPIARSRVRQQRFSRIVAIFHHLELQTVQHSQDHVINDQTSFRKWIRTESAIRLATIATMLDNAFGIFNNVAPRLQWAEIDLTFPSSDIYFELANHEEMMSKSLYPQPKMKIKSAFFALCTPPEHAGSALKELRDGDLTALDMQMLIYFLYTHVWTSVFNSPLLSHHGFFIAPFRNALMNWKTVWDEIRHSESEWDSSGFHSSAVEYYGAINAIISSFETSGGNLPVIPSDCEKGLHLKRLLKLG